MVFLYACKRLSEGKCNVFWKIRYEAGDAIHTLIAMLRTKLGQRLDRESLPFTSSRQARDCIVSKSDRHELALGNNLSINSCLSSSPIPICVLSTVGWVIGTSPLFWRLLSTSTFPLPEYVFAWHLRHTWPLDRTDIIPKQVLDFFRKLFSPFMLHNDVSFFGTSTSFPTHSTLANYLQIEHNMNGGVLLLHITYFIDFHVNAIWISFQKYPRFYFMHTITWSNICTEHPLGKPNQRYECDGTHWREIQIFDKCMDWVEVIFFN